MEDISKLIETIGSIVWGWPMIIMLLGTHILLTIRLHFPQRHVLKAIRLIFTRDDGAKGDVSQFASLATSLAATIGNGNIVGVATAIVLGGSGAVFWCWVTGLLGMATKYGEGLLAVKYRQTTSDGKMLGGPMYALEKGLGMKWLAVLFCVFAAMASFGIGDMTQSNAISSLFCGNEHLPEIPKWVTGIVVAVLAGIVILGGVKSISKVCSRLVPFMAAFYILGCLYILCCNYAYILPAIREIVVCAFDPSAVSGGLVGGGIMLTIRYGIARGLFSNESGLGSAPIVAAAAQTRNSVRQALVSSTGTFFDTVIICAVTGIVLVSSKQHFAIEITDAMRSNGFLLSEAAFSRIPYVGLPLLYFGIITFAFSTILGWGYYGERAVEYLGGKRFITAYRALFVGFVFVGAVFELNLVWNLSDIMNALMAVPNLIALICLSGVIVKDTRYYLWQHHLDEADADVSQPDSAE